MARFVSRSSNLLIVLRAGLSAQPITGTPAKPTLSVRFKDGLADVPDGELVELMKAHPGFNSDFILADLGEIDPYTRTSSEPAHVLTEINYGSPTAKKVVGDQSAFSPELMKLIDGMASQKADKKIEELLPGLVEKALKALINSQPSVPTHEKEPTKVVEKEVTPKAPAKKVVSNPLSKTDAS